MLYDEWKSAQPITLSKKEQASVKKKRQALRQELMTALRNNVNRAREWAISEYKGFSLILPARMLEEEPFVILEGIGRYRIPLGSTHADPLPHLDGFIANLENRKKRCEDILQQRQTEKQLLESELAAHNYADEILRLTKKLERIDKELGVNADE